MPPCCSAWLVMFTPPSGSSRNFSISALAQNDADTRITMSSAIKIIADNTAVGSIVATP